MQPAPSGSRASCIVFVFCRLLTKRSSESSTAIPFLFERFVFISSQQQVNIKDSPGMFHYVKVASPAEFCNFKIYEQMTDILSYITFIVMDTTSFESVVE
jgi:hypothetical protein